MLSYFPHDVNSIGHWKFKALKKKYGYEGKGRFWDLNCLIASEPNCRLDLTREPKLIAIAEELDMEVEEFKGFLKFLSQKDLQLIKKDRDGYYTDRVDETKALILQNRKRQKNFYEKKKGKKPKVDEKAIREFYAQQIKLSNDQQFASKYLHFVKYLYNESQNPNCINEPGTHILHIAKQITYSDFEKLFQYCKIRNTSPVNLLDSWLNNKSYSKGRVSVYATLRSWASRESIKHTNQ